MVKFSQLLITRIQSYLKERYDTEISIETAEEYLNSMADLYGCFIEFLEKK